MEGNFRKQFEGPRSKFSDSTIVFKKQYNIIFKGALIWHFSEFVYQVTLPHNLKLTGSVDFFCRYKLTQFSRHSNCCVCYQPHKSQTLQAHQFLSVLRSRNSKRLRNIRVIGTSGSTLFLNNRKTPRRCSSNNCKAWKYSKVIIFYDVQNN